MPELWAPRSCCWRERLYLLLWEIGFKCFSDCQNQVGEHAESDRVHRNVQCRTRFSCVIFMRSEAHEIDQYRNYIDEYSYTALFGRTFAQHSPHILTKTNIKLSVYICSEISIIYAVTFIYTITFFSSLLIDDDTSVGFIFLRISIRHLCAVTLKSIPDISSSFSCPSPSDKNT